MEPLDKAESVDVIISFCRASTTVDGIGNTGGAAVVTGSLSIVAGEEAGVFRACAVAGATDTVVGVFMVGDILAGLVGVCPAAGVMAVFAWVCNVKGVVGAVLGV